MSIVALVLLGLGFYFGNAVLEDIEWRKAKAKGLSRSEYEKHLRETESWKGPYD